MLKALSFLGVGPKDGYRTTTYLKDDGKTSWTTHLFQEAVTQLYEPEQIVIFATSEVLKDKKGYLAYLYHQLRSKLRIETVSDGKSTDELWQIFNVYADAVNEGDKIILDITHGFRSFPVLALPAIAYLRQVKKAEFTHILYGAFEAGDRIKNQTPIFDLTPFVDLLDWTNAVNIFQHSGDARQLAGLKGVRTIGDKLTTLSNALLTNRTLEAQEAVPRLVGKLESPKTLERLESPFHMLIDQVKDTYAGISVQKPKGNPRDSLTGQYAQIKWYIDNLHYLHAVTLIREWLVSWEFLRTHPTSSGDWLKKDCREKAAKDLNSRFLKSPDPLDKLWSYVDTRNDLSHCGMRTNPDPRPANSAIKIIEKLFKEFESFFQGLVKAGELPPPK